MDQETRSLIIKLAEGVRSNANASLATSEHIKLLQAEVRRELAYSQGVMWLAIAGFLGMVVLYWLEHP